MSPAPQGTIGEQRAWTARFHRLFQACPDRRARLFLVLCILVMAAVLGYSAWDTLFPASADMLRIAAREPVARGVPPQQEADGRMSINDASPEDLVRASGIGPALAQAIVDAREEMGGFRFWEELRDVPGIGQKRMDALAEYFYCPYAP